MKQNQNPATSYDRFQKYLNKEKGLSFTCQILSFGCSTGEECETLHKLYFPNTKIWIRY